MLLRRKEKWLIQSLLRWVYPVVGRRVICWECIIKWAKVLMDLLWQPLIRLQRNWKIGWWSWSGSFPIRYFIDEIYELLVWPELNQPLKTKLKKSTKYNRNMKVRMKSFFDETGDMKKSIKQQKYENNLTYE